MTARASKRIAPAAAGSRRVLIGGHPYRLRWFADGGPPDPPAGVVVVPADGVGGCFWIEPEYVRLMPAESSHA